MLQNYPLPYVGIRNNLSFVCERHIASHMKFLLLLATLQTGFASISSESLAGSWFSVQLKGRDVRSELIIPVQDHSLVRQARLMIEKVNVNLSNRTHLTVQFKLPNTLATAQNLIVFEGDIRNNFAQMSGPIGTMLCRIDQANVTCRFQLQVRQTNLNLLERQLRARKWPEVIVKNQLDVANQFNLRRFGFIRFSREAAGLNYSR